MARGLPQAESAGIFPDTYACVSLLYADPLSVEQLPIDHATGDDEYDASGIIDNVSDVAGLPFKIMPHARTGIHPRSVNPKWHSKFTLERTRPSFIVLDGPNYTKRLFSSQRDVPLQGQNVLVLVTVHEQQRFGAHKRMGCIVLELKPGPPVSEWFTLHRSDGTPVPSSTGKGYASVHLRIAYPGFISDSMPYKSLSIDRTAKPQTPFPRLFVQQFEAQVSTMFAPYHLSEPGDESVWEGRDARPVRGDNSHNPGHVGGDSPANREGNSEPFLERVARQIFKVNQFGHKSPSPSRTLGTTRNRRTMIQSITDSPESLPVKHFNFDEDGLYIQVLAGTNLPQRLSGARDPCAYASVSLALVSEREQKAILQGERQLKHVVWRRGSGTPAQNAARHCLRLEPQSQTSTYSASQHPTWADVLYLNQAIRVADETLRPESLTGFTAKGQDAFVVLVSVLDSFEFGSDRILGSASFPIQPGQRLERTLVLEVSDRLQSNKPVTIRVRAHLKIPPATISGVASNDPSPQHREVSPSLSPSKTPMETRAVPARSSLDLSDSDSDNSGDISPHTTAPSSTHSNLSRSSRGQHACVVSDRANPSPNGTETTPVQPKHGPQVPRLIPKTPTATGACSQSPSSERQWRRSDDQIKDHHKKGSPSYTPSYTELEKAFMARVAARQSQAGQLNTADNAMRAATIVEPTSKAPTHALSSAVSGWKPLSRS